MKHKTPILLSIALFYFVTFANAEEIQLETIVITSGKTQTSLKNDIANTVVMTQENIQKIHARNIMDLLRHVPGMTLNDTGTGSYYIGFRGTAPAPKGTMIMLVADFKYTFHLHMIELTLSAKNLFNTTYAEYGKMNGGSYINWVPVAYLLMAAR